MSNHEKHENKTRKRRDKGKHKGVIMPVSGSSIELPEDYTVFLTSIKKQIRTERLTAVLAANSSLVLMYWDIGQSILRKQKNEGWGAKVIDRLSSDLKEAFPDMNGFSSRNLKYMRKFAETWPEKQIVQEVLAQISWYHNLALIEKLKEQDLRLWYARQTIENGWSRNILVVQIETALHKRIGQTANNFTAVLPPDESDMANQIFKDPYLFDFLGTAEVRLEAELERKLILKRTREAEPTSWFHFRMRAEIARKHTPSIGAEWGRLRPRVQGLPWGMIPFINHLEKFLLELGQGFAFVGRQVHMEVSGDDFYIDLLFYHLKLRCYVIVELKAGKFCPGHISQLTMYMNIVDDMLRHPDDKPTIGLLLVKEKNHTVVKYALAGNTKPIGVAEWEQQIIDSLPEDLKPSLPSVKEIERELNQEPRMNKNKKENT